MTWPEPPHRHTLTPIGDEWARRGEPLEIGEPSVADLVRRRLDHLRLPAPRTRIGRVLHLLAVFLIAWFATTCLALAFGALCTVTSYLSDPQAFMVGFIVVGMFVALPAMLFAPGRRTRRDRPAERRSGRNDEPTGMLRDLSEPLPYWPALVLLGAILVATGFAVDSFL